MTHFKKHLSLSRTYFVIIGILIVVGIGAMVAPFNQYSEGMNEPNQDETETEKEGYKEGLWEGPSKNWSKCELGLLIVLVYLAAGFLIYFYRRIFRGETIMYVKI